MLTPGHFNSSQEAQELINKIAGMLHRGEIKVVKGSLSSDIIDMEFKLKGTPGLWSLRGVLDAHGGLSLSKI